MDRFLEVHLTCFSSLQPGKLSQLTLPVEDSQVQLILYFVDRIFRIQCYTLDLTQFDDLSNDREQTNNQVVTKCLTGLNGGGASGVSKVFHYGLVSP